MMISEFRNKWGTSATSIIILVIAERRHKPMRETADELASDIESLFK